MQNKQIKQDRFVDTHFHSRELARKGIEPHAELARSFAAELEFGLDIAVDEQGWPERLELAGRFSSLYISLGFSPAYVNREDWEKAAGRLRECIISEQERTAGAGVKSKLIAVGEIGLDDYWKYGTPEQQESLLVSQLRVADEWGLPVIIHNREADTGLLRVLKAHQPRAGGIIHCFSSDYRMATQLVSLGFFISFAGNLTYKNAENIQEAARRLPATCLLLETDAPYLTPQPVRGEVNRPAFVRYTYEYLARLRGLSLAALHEQVKANLQCLFPGLLLFSGESSGEAINKK